MATGVNEMRTGYTDTTIQRRVITDMIKMIDWAEAPMLKMLGLDNQARFKFMNWPHREYEWLEDELPVEEDLLDGSLTAGATTVTVDNGPYFRVGHVIRVEDEQMYVTAVSGNDLTVTRGYAGTTAATHADNLTVYILFTAMPEGADAENEYTTNADVYSNVRQIMSGSIRVSGSQQAFSDYGITDTKGYHLAKLIGGNKVGTKWRGGTVPQQLEKTLWEGKKFKSTTNATADQMGGYEQFVTTNVTDAASKRLSRKMIEDLMENCHKKNGNPTTLLVGTFQQRVISQMFEGLIRTDRSEEDGGHCIKTVVTDFGDLEVVSHRRFPQDKLYMFDPADMGWCTIRPFDTRPLETQGDYEKVFYVGEYGFALCAEMHHGLIKNLATTW